MRWNGMSCWLLTAGCFNAPLSCIYSLTHTHHAAQLDDSVVDDVNVDQGIIFFPLFHAHLKSLASFACIWQYKYIGNLTPTFCVLCVLHLSHPLSLSLYFYISIDLLSLIFVASLLHRSTLLFPFSHPSWLLKSLLLVVAVCLDIPPIIFCCLDDSGYWKSIC